MSNLKFKMYLERTVGLFFSSFRGKSRLKRKGRNISVRIIDLCKSNKTGYDYSTYIIYIHKKCKKYILNIKTNGDDAEKNM